MIRHAPRTKQKVLLGFPGNAALPGGPQVLAERAPRLDAASLAVRQPSLVSGRSRESLATRDARRREHLRPASHSFGVHYWRRRAHATSFGLPACPRTPEGRPRGVGPEGIARSKRLARQLWMTFAPKTRGSLRRDDPRPTRVMTLSSHLPGNPRRTKQKQSTRHGLPWTSALLPRVPRGKLRQCCLILAALCACGRGARLVPEDKSPPPLKISLAHLRHLGLDAVVKGKPVRVVALYAEAPDYRPTGSPKRDGYEGIASLDDAARAAVLYFARLRRDRRHQSPAAKRWDSWRSSPPWSKATESLSTSSTHAGIPIGRRRAAERACRTGLREASGRWVKRFACSAASDLTH